MTLRRPAILLLAFWLPALPAQAQLIPGFYDGRPGLGYSTSYITFAILREEPALGFHVWNDKQRTGCHGWLWISATSIRLQPVNLSCLVDAPIEAVTKLERDKSSIRFTVGNTRVRLLPAPLTPPGNAVDRGWISDAEGTDSHRALLDALEAAVRSFDSQVALVLDEVRKNPQVATNAAAIAGGAAEEYIRRKRYLDGETWLTRAISLSPAGRWYWFRAFAKLQRQDSAGAKADLDRWLEFGSPYASYRRELGLLILTNDRVKARDSERLAASAAERSGNALVAFRHYQKAFALTLPTFANESDQAEELKTALVRTWRASQPNPDLPEEARRYAVQGLAFAEAKRYEEANQAFRTVNEICPWYPQAFFNRATVLAAMERYADAIASMNLYLAVVPDASDARAARDQIYKWEALSGSDGRAAARPSANADARTGSGASSSDLFERFFGDAGPAVQFRAAGTVYFFCASSGCPAGSTIYSDNTALADIRGGSYFGASIAPGRHTLMLKVREQLLWSSTIEVQIGASYYMDARTGKIESRDLMNVLAIDPLEKERIRDSSAFTPPR